MQTTHSVYTPASTQRKIIVACNGIKGPANIGGLFRLADGMGVASLLFDTAISLDSRRLAKTARSTHRWVNFKADVELIPLVKEAILNDFMVVSIEITSNSVPIQELSLDNFKNIMVLLGNEQNGVEPDLLALSHHVVHIPMFGTNSSLNVVQAASIALYEFRRNE